jgi:hypothetical protein
MGQLQTQRMARRAKADMTQHYTLADFQAQEQSVLALQSKIRGAKVVEIRASNEPDQAKLQQGRNRRRGSIRTGATLWMVGPAELESATSTVSR